MEWRWDNYKVVERKKDSLVRIIINGLDFVTIEQMQSKFTGETK